MAVAWFRNPVLDESAEVIDRSSVNERLFGVTTAKRHPTYVFGVNKNSCLMHKIANVEIQHYALIADGSKMGRLKQPAMIAHTRCGYSFALTPERSRTCAVPLPDAVLCGRCHGQLPTFRRSVASKDAKVAARVKLGCEVAGYPSLLEDDNRKKAAKGFQQGQGDDDARKEKRFRRHKPHGGRGCLRFSIGSATARRTDAGAVGGRQLRA